MNATDIKTALAKRWPPDSTLLLDEAPDGPDRMGRKLDVLAISLWRSRGFECDGVEIKISYNDWTRERKNPAKAEWWWDHVHRFWVACPTDIAAKIAPELPTGWGLLTVNETGRCVEAIKPDRHDAKPFTWPQTVGLLRGCANAGLNAIARARDEGYRQGKETAETRADRRVGDTAVHEELDRLRAVIDGYQKTSGIDLNSVWSTHGAEQLGRLVSTLRFAQTNPEKIRQAITQAAGLLKTATDNLASLSTTLDVELGTDAR